MSSNQERLTRWVAGFVDAEGCLSAEVKTAGEKEDTAYINNRFHLNHNYTAGLFDGDGSISIKVRENGDSVHGYSIASACAVKQTVHDEMIASLSGFCESIGVDDYSVRIVTREKEEHADQFAFRISNRSSVEKFLTELEPHLLLKKEQANIVLNDIIPKLERGIHTNRRGFLRVMKHVDELNSLKGGLRGEYNVEYFEDKWGMELER